MNKIIISASRRTDIPAFYMAWFMERIGLGTFETVNPFNRKTSTVPAVPDSVHSIVFWSKNFEPFLDGNFGEALLSKGYHLYFNFTVNSESPLLEPGVPPLDWRLGQMDSLCRRFGPDAVAWRFDPICFFRTGDAVSNNLGDFSRIADSAGNMGVKRCITSFMDDYPKIRRRIRAMDGFAFVDPQREEKLKILLDMEKTLGQRGIVLHTCCEKDLLDGLPGTSRVTSSECIPGGILTGLYGGGRSLRQDTGQRVAAGCGCRVSVDIGDYRHHPCRHGCLFCYANPA
jgi:hypothetical protein